MPITIPTRGISFRVGLSPRYRGMRVISTAATHILLDGVVVCRTPLDPSGVKRVDRVAKRSLCTRCRRALKAAGVIA